MEKSPFRENNGGESGMHHSFTPPKLKELGNSKDDSLTSIDIQEMERVRSSLQSMLKSSEHLLRDDKILPERSYLDQGIRHQVLLGGVDQDSFTSIGTSDLLHNYVNTDEQVIDTVTDSTTLDETSSESIRRSRHKYDKSLVIENSLLNESLAKERSKRKHCEQQIKGLQSKLLEAQQELAVSVSAERKKDVMINQLDKTLARVVEDWKKHEQEKLNALSNLEERRQQDEQSQRKQQEMLTQFERDLSQAVEALSNEQERAEIAEQTKDSQIAAIAQERDQLFAVLAEESRKVSLLETSLQQLQEKYKREEESFRLLGQEKHSWQEEKTALESQIELIAKAHREDVENERKLVEHEKQVAEDSQRVLAAVQKEVQLLAAQLDTSNREKENLKTEITLLTAKFEAQKTRQESEHQAELERQLSKNLREVQSQLTKNENEMRTAHKKQIEELTRKYKCDLDDQLQNFHQQLKERDKKLKQTNEEYEERLSKAHAQLIAISTEREALRNEKHNMVARLQKMMQSHCEEALSLLVANTADYSKVKTIDNHRDESIWISGQPPAPVPSASFAGVSRGLQHDLPLFVNPGRNNGMGESPTTVYKTQHVTTSWENSTLPTHDGRGSEHNWITLPSVKATQTSHTSYLDSHIPANQTGQSYSHVHNHELQETAGEERDNLSSDNSSPGEQIRTQYPSRSTVTDRSDENDGQKQPYTEMSSSTTNESMVEQTYDEDPESEKPNLPLNLSTDVLKMLQQQQSRQTELNHYVRELLKRSPSSASGGEMPDVAASNMASSSFAGHDVGVSVISPVEEHALEEGSTVQFSNTKISPTDILMPSSDPDTSKQVNNKQMAFRKSAATPRKDSRSSKIPVAHTPPQKDNTSGEENSRNPVLTPEQVGQLARLIQIYQKDNDSDDLPSPQRMFQYLRDVQTRSEIKRSKSHLDQQEIAASQQAKRDSKVKRKLQVNIPQNKSKNIGFSTDLQPTDKGPRAPSQRLFSQDGPRRASRAPLTSDSELSVSRRSETKIPKSSNGLVKQPKRLTGKSGKTWK